MRLMYRILFIGIILFSCSSSKNKNKHQFPRISQRTDIQLEIDQELKTPILMKGDLSSFDVLDKDDASESALLFVEQNKDVFNLKEPRKELVAVETTTDNLGFQHVTFQRRVQDVSIWTDELKIHFNKDGILYFVNGRYHQSLPEDFETKPVLKPKEAEGIALADAEKNVTSGKVNETELVIFPRWGTYHLVFRINVIGGLTELENWEYFVDAKNGEIVHKYNNVQNMQN